MSIRIAVLASGRGSNLQAILDAIAAGTLPAEIAGVFSDRPDAPALQRVPAALRWAATPKSFADKASYEQALGDAIAASSADWIVCAGYMRILGEALVQRFAGRMINIHPSLLPRHRCLHTHARAIEAGDLEHGASVHFVVPELDAGSVLAQSRVPVLAQDTPEQLATRVLTREHPLLVASLALLASNRVSEHAGRILLDGQPLDQPAQLDDHDHLAS